MEKITAQKLQHILAEVRRSNAFGVAEKSQDLRKQGYKKLSYEEFAKTRKFPSLSYVGAQRKVWNVLESELQKNKLSKNMLKDTELATALYNDLFVENGSFAKKYGLELAPTIENTGETPMSEEVKNEEDPVAGAEPEEVKNEEAKNEKIEADENILDDASFWDFVNSGNSGINKEMYKNDPAAYKDQVTELYNGWKNQQKGNEPEQGEEQAVEPQTAENGELNFVEDAQAVPEDWIEEYNQYLTKYGEEHDDTWTCDNKVGSLDGHFTKGPNFSYSAPDHLSFGYKEGEKPEPKDFYAVLSLAKEKKQALDWGGNMSTAAREAVMQACADMGVNIVGLSEEEQKKFDALRGAQEVQQEAQAEKQSPEQERTAKREKALAEVAKMRHRIREGADSAEMRGTLLENAEGLGLSEEQKAKTARRKEIYELRQQGATTYGDDEASKKLLGLEIADCEVRVAVAKEQPELGSKHAEARLHNLQAIRDGGPDKAAAIEAETKRDEAIKKAHEQACSRYRN